jgi:hypothetical protein
MTCIDGRKTSNAFANMSPRLIEVMSVVSRPAIRYIIVV